MIRILVQVAYTEEVNGRDKFPDYEGEELLFVKNSDRLHASLTKYYK